MENTPPKKNKFKIYLALAILTLILAAITYGYYLKTKVESLKTEKAFLSEQVTNQVNATIMLDSLKSEYIRCQKVVTQEQGKFAEFEYCKGLIKWFDTNISNPQK